MLWDVSALTGDAIQARNGRLGTVGDRRFEYVG